MKSAASSLSLFSARLRLRLAPGEGAMLAALTALFFCRGAAAVCFDTAAGTAFLSEFGAARLPFIYLGGALAGVAFGTLYVRLAARPGMGAQRLLPGTLAVALGVALGAALAVRHPALACAAMLWKEIAFNFLNIVVWGTASRLFDVRQGKRLFGFVAAGGIAANIAAGLAVPALARWGGVPGLFSVSAAALAAGLAVLLGILRAFPEKFAAGPSSPHVRPGKSEAAAPEEGGGGGGLWRSLAEDRYLRLFLFLSVLSNFAFFFTDFLYFDRLDAMFHTEENLAAFMGRFSAWVGVGQLVLSLFLSGTILSRFGLAAALAVLPWACGFAVSGAVGALSLFGTGGGFFWLIIAAKLADEVFRAALLGPAFRILYQPLPEDEQFVFQARAESVIDPAGAGLAGGLLLLLTVAWAVPPAWLCGLLALFLVGWIVVARKMGGEYGRRLARALTRRRLSGTALTLDDASVALLLKMAGSADPGAVLHALDLLERADRPEWPQLLAAALRHEAEEVRLWAIERIGRTGTRSPAPWEAPLRALWIPGGAAEARIARAALGAAIRLGHAEALRFAQARFPGCDGETRREVLAAFLARSAPAPEEGGVESGPDAWADERLAGLLRSGTASDRLEGIAVLTRLGAETRSDPLSWRTALLPLLFDPDESVRLAALRAALPLAGEELVSPLLAALRERPFRPAAAAALHACGPAAVGPLGVVANGAETFPASARRVALRLLGRAEAGTTAWDHAREALLSAPDDEDKVLRQERLRALAQTGWTVPRRDRAAWLARLTEEAGEAAGFDHLARLLAAHPPLREALEREAREARLQILRLLSLFPGGRELRALETVLVGERARPGAASPSPALSLAASRRRAKALELLDTLLPAEAKGVVLPLFDPAPASPTNKGDPAALLLDLIAAPRSEILPWTRACALYALGGSAHAQPRAGTLKSALPALRASVEDEEEEAFVRETARWAEGRILALAPTPGH
ncbi:TLC ATP/ADP transporter [Verrucomicrobium sp. GAS474]|uniref:Npt1/Npt2 family nucleotide transporter n=1 Tax=Verrucomicrobium sp. GAS474 TaxID=1882831 RepID=UPI00087B8001|nr:Npt1/Npt2 family nucleotide transporter [Verrucomicrobium sp. GAS474]SDT91479.1 TLC ATP/ADP transporter [Verrucomicrobium sp. GAS474]